MRNLSVLALIGTVGLVAGTANAAINIAASSVPFVDISVTGTSVGTIGDDSNLGLTASQLSTAGFAGNELLAGGVGITVGNNGGIIWGSTTGVIGWANSNPNNASNPSISGAVASATTTNGNGNGTNQFLAVLWDDNTPGTGGSCRWQVISGDLIIQWTNEDHFNATGSGVITYQAIIRGGVTIGSGLSLVDYVYQDTLYAANQYQDDGGSATIGYKNWGVNINANDVEYGTGGGSGSTTTDPAFGTATMQAKVSGWVAANNTTLTHSVSISGVPAPSAAALLGLGGLVGLRRRRA
jgi:MYXO-CTERM domain-containing protein